MLGGLQPSDLEEFGVDPTECLMLLSKFKSHMKEMASLLEDEGSAAAESITPKVAPAPAPIETPLRLALRRIGHEQFTERFEAEDVTLDFLVALPAEDLAEFDIDVDTAKAMLAALSKDKEDQLSAPENALAL